MIAVGSVCHCVSLVYAVNATTNITGLQKDFAAGGSTPVGVDEALIARGW